MPYNGSGTFSLTYNWATEQASSPIEIAKLDTQESDIASGLSNCILRDGTGLPSTTIPWNSQALTGVSNLSAERVTVTGSTVPANGMYLSAANTVAWSSNTTLRASVNSTGNWVFAAPSSGTALSVSAASGATGINITEAAIPKVSLTTSVERAYFQYTEGTSTARIDSDGILELASNNTSRVSIASAGNVTIAAPSSGTALAVTGESGAATIATFGRSGVSPSLTFKADGTDGYLGTAGAHPLNLLTNGTSKLTITSAGNVTINAASSGTELTVTGEVAATTFIGALTGDVTGNVTGNVSGSSGSCTGNAATATALQTARTINGVSFNGTASITVTAAADTLTGTTLAALSGANLTALNATQLTSGTVPDARFPATLPALSGANLTSLNATQLTSGTVPSARMSGAYTGITSISDTATVNTFTIGYRQIPLSGTTSGSLPTSDVGKMVAATAGITIPNSTFSAGDAVSIVNDSASAITITASITTLYWTQTGGTGTRTLAARGSCTVWFKSGTVAYISGAGLS